MSEIRRHSPSGSTRASKPERHAWLSVIAVYKLAKTIGLILIAIAAFRLERSVPFEHLVHWLEQLSLDDSSGLRWKLVEKLQSMGPSKFVAIGMIALQESTQAFAGFFAVDGAVEALRFDA